MEQTAGQNLYNLLVTKDLEPEMLDAQGKPVMNASDADLFSFDWKTENNNYGTVVILMGQDNELEVYYGDNLGRGMESEDKKQWYDFLAQMKNFASRNLLTFELNNINRLKYTMQGLSAIKEGLFEGYYGKKNVSYSDEPMKTRLMIKHNRNLGEGEARYRAIESLFVETPDGERFKLPFRNLTGGRIMARHVSEGGNPYDPFGQHICQMINEINTMSSFIRASKKKNFEESTHSLIEAGIRHYGELKDKARRMISRHGYLEQRELFDPAAANPSDNTVDAVRSMFIEKYLDPRIESALPLLVKIKETDMKEINEFESWANNVTEGTWALPDSPETETRLKKLMSQPLPVGPDGSNATEQLYDLVGDDQLFDFINDLAEQDPNANVWDNPAIINRLGELGIDITATTGAPATNDVDEGMMDTVKKVGGSLLDKLGHGSDEDLLKALQRKAGIPAHAQHGKPAMAHDRDEEQLGELSKGTLSNYVNKAVDDVVDRSHSTGIQKGARIASQAFAGGKKDAGRFEKDSRIDNRKVGVSRAMSKLGEILAASKEEPKENLDTAGVMMTKPSNMSSESVDPLIQLKRLLK